MFFTDENRTKLARIDQYLNTLSPQDMDDAIESDRVIQKLKDDPIFPTMPITELVNYIDFLEAKISTIEFEHSKHVELIREITDYLISLDESLMKGSDIICSVKHKQGIW